MKWIVYNFDKLKLFCSVNTANFLINAMILNEVETNGNLKVNRVFLEEWGIFS